MSRIYFHTREEDVEDVQVLGTERHWMGALCWQITEGFLQLDRYGDDMLKRFRSMIPDGHYLKAPDLRREQHFRDDFMTAFRVEYSGTLLAWQGRAISPWRVMLNTAVLVGSDAIKLCARLHGQCEIHAWVEGKNRAWLARIIERGLEEGVLREGHPGDSKFASGWRNAIKLLRSSKKTPIVTSYSVCEQFPGVHLLSPRDGEPQDHDEFYEWALSNLTHEQRWDRAMVELRARRASVELKPSDWRNYYFGDGITALDLTASDFGVRLDKKLGIEPEQPKQEQEATAP